MRLAASWNLSPKTGLVLAHWFSIGHRWFQHWSPLFHQEQCEHPKYAQFPVSKCCAFVTFKTWNYCDFLTRRIPTASAQPWAHGNCPFGFCRRCSSCLSRCFPAVAFPGFFWLIPRADGAWPNLVCLNSVANALERSGDWKAALELLKRHLGKFSWTLWWRSQKKQQIDDVHQSHRGICSILTPLPSIFFSMLAAVAWQFLCVVNMCPAVPKSRS